MIVLGCEHQANRKTCPVCAEQPSRQVDELLAGNAGRQLKTKYKYISFVGSIPNKNKKVWQCLNNSSKEELGLVKWYSAWKRYCYFPTVQAVYSDDCLDDISHFIKQLAS